MMASAQPTPEALTKPTATAQSVDDRAKREPLAFWSSLWQTHGGVIGDQGKVVCESKETFPYGRWFPGAKLNYAENLLQQRNEELALIYWGNKAERRGMSRAQLYAETSRCVAMLQSLGVAQGDVVAALLPNVAEAVIAMLATAALGARWVAVAMPAESMVSSAAEFVERQRVIGLMHKLAPKVLISVDGVAAPTKKRSYVALLTEISQQIAPTMVVLPLADLPLPVAHVTWRAAMDKQRFRPINFVRGDFDAPLAMTSTAGVHAPPRIIVHGQGGLLLQQIKDHRLVVQLSRGDRLLFAASPAHPLWLWAVGALASGVTLVLHDAPSPLNVSEAFWDILNEERVSHWLFPVAHLGFLSMPPAARYPHLRQLLPFGEVVSSSDPLLRLKTLPGEIGCRELYFCAETASLLAASAAASSLSERIRQGKKPLQPTPGMALAVRDNAQTLAQGTGGLAIVSAYPGMPLGLLGDNHFEHYRRRYVSDDGSVWFLEDRVWLDTGGLVVLGEPLVVDGNGYTWANSELKDALAAIVNFDAFVWLGQQHAPPSARAQGNCLLLTLQHASDWSHAVDVAIKAMLQQKMGVDPASVRVIQIAEIPTTLDGRPHPRAVAAVLGGAYDASIGPLSNPDALAYLKNSRS